MDDIRIRTIKEIINNYTEITAIKSKSITRIHRIGFIAGVVQTHARYGLRHVTFIDAIRLVTKAFDDLNL